MIKSSPRNETKPPIWPSSVRAAVREETTSPVSVPISSEGAIGIWSGIKINETKRNETGADHLKDLLKEPLLEGISLLVDCCSRELRPKPNDGTFGNLGRTGGLSRSFLVHRPELAPGQCLVSAIFSTWSRRWPAC